MPFNIIMIMEGFVIKGFARSLTIINDQKYDGCYMAKAKFETFNTCNKEYNYVVSIEKSNHRLCIIKSEGYLNNVLMGRLTVYLVINNNIKKANTNNEDKVRNLKFWRRISKEEVYDFSKYTNDINSIHLNSNPIVQGLLTMMNLNTLVKYFKVMEVKFSNPIYAEQPIYINILENRILGYSNNEICFKCNFIQ